MNPVAVGWRLLLCLTALVTGAAPLVAQSWNDARTMQLVARGIAARQRAEPDTTLTGYQALAHGFVFSLAQAGASLDGAPRLIKADELRVEVYWRAPASSKQVIQAWRDGRWLPTDVNYHRDHLGIVTNNFGDRIRIGEGDEVRDVPHPLAPDGPGLYQYRLRDSVRLKSRDDVRLLHEIEIRPRDPAQPRILGTLSLDAATGDLVRLRFSFTRAAYLDGSLEDISILLENARTEGRWWLPWRQEIEIRRRVSWFDFPARTIIRGRWEIGDYVLNPTLPPERFRGAAIGGMLRPDAASAEWPEPLADAVRDAARPVEQRDLDQVRAEIERLAAGRLVSGLPRARPGVSSLSDLLHVNRVQGLAVGAGAGFRPAPRVLLRPRIGFGTSDRRLLADLALTWRTGAGTVKLTGGRRLRDLSDYPLLSPLVNSLLSQEGGRDQGDYVLVDAAGLALTHRLGTGATMELGGGVERGRSVAAEARPARGSYRPNPALGAGTLGVGRLSLDLTRRTLERAAESSLRIDLEGGTGDRHYARAVVRTELRRPAGPGVLLLGAEGGAGTAELPRYRSFAVGGWGTLPGEPFRAYGGRRYALGRMEYRFPVPFPALPLGAFVSTGNRITLAPFVAAGVTGGPVSAVPWRPSRTVRPVAGLAVEWLHGLIRAETGVSLRTGNVGVSVDLNREWWDVL